MVPDALTSYVEEGSLDADRTALAGAQPRRGACRPSPRPARPAARVAPARRGHGVALAPRAGVDPSARAAPAAVRADDRLAVDVLPWSCGRDGGGPCWMPPYRPAGPDVRGRARPELRVVGDPGAATG